MSARRTYGDRCGIARALDLVGERWALLVVRELLLGPKRFTDLRSGLPHVSPDVLSQRLRELEESGLVRRGKLPPPAGSRIYELTERGRQLEPVILELGRFGSVAPIPSSDAKIGADALAIAVIESDPGALASVLWHGRKLADAKRAAEIRMSGSDEAAQRFLAMFPLPGSAAADGASR